LTVTEPDLAAGWELALAVTVTEPSPWPERGDTCNHDASLAAVQLHSRAAVTLIVAPPPPAGNGAPDEATVA
jgi:hypothetical protein